MKQLAALVLFLALCVSAARADSPPLWPANTPGSGCSGIIYGANTPISPAGFAANWTTSTTTLIAGVAGKTTHICEIEITGVTTTAGVLDLFVGTNANCVAGNNNVKVWQIGVTPAGFAIVAGNGATDLYGNSIQSGQYVCLGGATFVGTITGNITYAQY